MGVSLLLLLIMKRIDYHHLGKISLFFLVFSLGLLVLVLFVEPTKGVHRWLTYNWISFQPSELFKYSLILFMAYTLAKKKDKIKNLKQVAIPYLIILGVGLLLILKQPHLGAAFIISLVAFLLLFLAGAKLRHLLLPAFSVILLGLIMVLVFNYEKDRLNDYKNSLSDPLFPGHQSLQVLPATQPIVCIISLYNHFSTTILLSIQKLL